MLTDEDKAAIRDIVREEIRLTVTRMLDERGLNNQQLSEMDKLIHESPVIQYIMRAVEDAGVQARGIAETFAELNLEKYKNKPKALINFMRKVSKPAYDPLVIEEQLFQQALRYVENTANNGLACRIINDDAREIIINMQTLPKEYRPTVVGEQWMSVQIILHAARLIRQPTVDEVIALGVPFNRRDRVKSTYPHMFVMKRPAPTIEE